MPVRCSLGVEMIDLMIIKNSAADIVLDGG